MRLYTVFVFHFLSVTFLNIRIRASQNGFPGTKPHIWHSAYANKENLLTTAAEQAVVSRTNLVVPPRVACRPYKYRKCTENTTQHFRNDDVTLHVGIKKTPIAQPNKVWDRVCHTVFRGTWWPLQLSRSYNQHISAIYGRKIRMHSQATVRKHSNMQGEKQRSSTKKKRDQHAWRLNEPLNGLYSAAYDDNEAELQNQCSLQWHDVTAISVQQ